MKATHPDRHQTNDRALHFAQQYIPDGRVQRSSHTFFDGSFTPWFDVSVAGSRIRADKEECA